MNNSTDHKLKKIYRFDELPNVEDLILDRLQVGLRLDNAHNDRRRRTNSVLRGENEDVRPRSIQPVTELVLGAKSSRLHQMYQAGFPVPSGFTISTQAFFDWRRGEKIDQILGCELEQALSWLQEKSQGFPVYAVRSGAPVSMPGILDTLLNVGLNDAFFLDQQLSPQKDVFLFESYIHWMQNFAAKIEGKIWQAQMEKFHISNSLFEALAHLKYQYEEAIGKPFPQDPKEQLIRAIEAVFQSWDSKRAIRYRKNEGLDESLGLACTVQLMVFGNKNQRSGSGVVFSRNPSTGEKELFGEFLHHQQGDALVDGTAIPMPLTNRQKKEDSEKCFEDLFPEAFSKLAVFAEQLESHFQDMQDIEFVVSDEEVFIVQARDGKRTLPAKLRIAVNFVHEGLWDKATALKKTNFAQIQKQKKHSIRPPSIVEDNHLEKLFDGLVASPGVAVGKMATDIKSAHELLEQNQPVIWFCQEASPEQIPVIQKVQGIVATIGGLTCHAAVVARSLNIPCLVGCPSVQVLDQQGAICSETETEKRVIQDGEWVTLHATEQTVYLGEAKLQSNMREDAFSILESWFREQEKDSFI